MRIPVVPIGNARGIRIPRAVLALLGDPAEVDLVVAGQRILLTPLPPTPRAGWEEAFRAMHARGDDHLLLDSEEAEEP